MMTEEQEPALDMQKVLDYLAREVENPQCASPKCVCLNLIQAIRYGDFNQCSQNAKSVKSEHHTAQQQPARSISDLDRYAREKRPFPKHTTLAEKISGKRYEECHILNKCKEHDCEECWYDSEDYWYDIGPGTPTVHEIRKWQQAQQSKDALAEIADKAFTEIIKEAESPNYWEDSLKKTVRIAKAAKKEIARLRSDPK